MPKMSKPGPRLAVVAGALTTTWLEGDTSASAMGFYITLGFLKTSSSSSLAIINMTNTSLSFLF